MALQINPELQSLIPPLTPEQYDTLEANLLADGCRDALIVWDGGIKKTLVLLKLYICGITGTVATDGVPVASVQKTSIRASMGKAVEQNEGHFPRLSWAKALGFLHG